MNNDPSGGQSVSQSDRVFAKTLKMAAIQFTMRNSFDLFVFNLKFRKSPEEQEFIERESMV